MAGAPRGNRNAEKPGKPGFTITIRITKPMRAGLEKMLNTESEEELKSLVRERIETMLDINYTETTLTGNGHTMKVTYYYRENGNDCDRESIQCSCGFYSYAQEGGGVWQHNRDETIPHKLDEVHREIYEGHNSPANEW